MAYRRTSTTSSESIHRFQSTVQIQDGTAGDVDTTVPEIWKQLSIPLVIAIHDLFDLRSCEGKEPVNWAWTVIDLLGIPKL